jgi:hypothetical protein
MDVKEIERIVDQASRKLFQMSSPPVKYWLMTEVMGKDEHDAILKETIRQCANYPPKTRLLSKLGADGTWPIPKHKKMAEDAGPGPPIGWTYRSALWNLSDLADYKTSRDEGHVDAALQRLLGWQTSEGFIPGPWTDAFPLPYFNAHAAYALLRFGMGRNRQVQKLLDWLMSIQRKDGGWNIPYLQDVHYLREYNWMRIHEFINFVKTADKSKFDFEKLQHIPSCQWSTMLIVRALIESPKLAKSEEVSRGAEFFLERFFKRNAHTTFYLTENHWTVLKYPHRFGSGLMALDLLTRLGYGPDDPRMEKPISWLVSARSGDGLWSQSMRPHPERDQWISLLAIRTLSRFAEMK